MSSQLLLVGSAPFDTAEESFRTIGRALGGFLAAMPDGEVGDRQYWVVRLAYQVFNGHPDLVTQQRPKPDNGVERLIPRGRAESWQFKVRDGVEHVKFGAPGWRLGYAKDAINSYFIFRTLKKEGVIPSSVRFQVCLPMTNSAVAPVHFPDFDDLPRVRPGYEEALGAEIDTIVSRIPNHDLAIQFDCSWELTDAYGGVPELPKEGRIERNASCFRNLCPRIPEQVQIGIHLCFGTFGGWPRFAPDDLMGAVELTNAAIEAAGRRMDWVHIPALNRTDDAFYAPLQKLKLRGCRVYLGLIHSMDSFKQRLATARRHLPEFGIAAYCGFGRIPPAELPKILADHVEAVRLLDA
jgi:hypothetical protein